MVRGKFAGLGFDPAPGNAGDVLAAADAMAGAGDRLAGSPGSMRAVLTPGPWQGAAAEGFATAGAPVPGALESAHGELRSASRALRTWHGQLKANQHAAERLDATARRLRDEIAGAERAVLAADARLAAATGPNHAPAAQALRSAQQDLAHLRTRMTTTLRAAHRLAQRHRREADTTAAALRGTPPSGSWPTTAVDGVATDVGGTSAWTGQVATIALPGETDPVDALPVGVQPGDVDWPVLPTDPVEPSSLDPAEIPELTGAAAAPVDPPAPIPPVSDLPEDLLGARPATETTRPAAAVLTAPVAEPVVAAVAGHRSVAARHREPVVSRVVTTPAQTVRSVVHESGASTPVHQAPVSHRSTSTATRSAEPIRHGEPGRHAAPAEPTPTGSKPAHQRHSGPGPVEHLARQTPAPAAAVPSAGPALPPSTATSATTAETAAVAPSADAATPGVATSGTATSGPGPSAVPPASPAPAGGDAHPGPAQPHAQFGGGQPGGAPAQPVPHQAAPPPSPGATTQVGADQGRASGQPGNQPGNQGGNAEHRKADPLPVTPFAADPLPAMYTDVVVSAPAQWDGTSVAPLHAAGLLPDFEPELMATFVITAALGPALIAESLAASAHRKRPGKPRRGKGNRMKAFLLQPDGEQLVVLTLQGRGAEGWTTQRALFLRAVAQYRPGPRTS